MSEGLGSSGEINVTVAFTSKRKPTLDWFFVLNTFAMYSEGKLLNQSDTSLSDDVRSGSEITTMY